MFTARDLLLDIGFEAARARLVNLVAGGALTGASHAAYAEGLTALIRVGPLGDVPGAGKLVRIQFLDPADRDGALQVGLRWEATGITSGLFPVLDGDFTLTPAEPDSARLALAGVYRPPLGRLGATLDTAVLRKVTDATITSLLRTVATAITSPATSPARAAGEQGAPLSRPAADPGAP